MHHDPYWQRQVQRIGEDTHQRRITLGDDSLANADPEPRLDGRELRRVIVDPQGERRPIDTRQVPHGRADEIRLGIEADQVVAGQVGQYFRHPAPVEIIAVRMETETNIPDMAGDQGFLGRLEHPHRYVGMALEQIIGLIG